MTTAGAAGAAARYVKARSNREAVAKFGEFWQALQGVGDALAEAQKAAKNAEDSTWQRRNQRHWDIAGVDDVRGSLRRCKSSLRIVSASAKRFEPLLLAKTWRR